MNVFEFADVVHQILYHQVCAVQLLHQQELFIVARLLLPLDEGAEKSPHMVVLAECQSQSLSCNIVLQ